MMPIQYTQKALAQLKKLREDVENLRNKEYSAPEVTAFFTASSHILEEIFDYKTAVEISNEFFRATMAYNSNQLLVAYNRQSGKIPQEPYDKLAARLDGLIKTVEFGMDRATSISQAVKSEKTKTPKIFISHAHADETAANLLVDLLHDMGIPNNTENPLIFCSSTPGFDIPLRKRIYEYLKKEFENHNLYVIFLLSSNYYKRPACLNEMGATWITETKYCSVLLPGFTFSQIEGAADADAMSIALADDNAWEGLNNLRKDLQKFMNFNSSPDNFWESRRLKFINAIKALPSANEVIEKDSAQIRILELEEKIRQLEDNQITCYIDNDTLVIGKKTDSIVTAQQAISRFLARPVAWNGKSFIGTFFIGRSLKDGYAVPMSDWLCQELQLDPGYPVTAKCVECESNKKIEIFATEDNADRLSDIDTLSVVELQLKTVYFTYEDYDNCNFGSPDICPYFIFEVEKILSVKAYEQPAPEPF